MFNAQCDSWQLFAYLCFMNNVNLDKLVELVGGGSVINGVHPSSLEDSISEQTPPPYPQNVDKNPFFFTLS